MKKREGLRRPPLYELYGELGRDTALDGLHVESIADRSRLHNWEIDLHRHATLVQLLLIERGQAQVQLDGDALNLPAPALVWVPAMSVHGFRFMPETEGHVVTLELEWLRELVGPASGALAELGHARGCVLRPCDDEAQALRLVVDRLQLEYRATRRWRGLALEGAVLSLVSQAARLPRLVPQVAAGAPAEGRAAQHLERFHGQVEHHFRDQPDLARLVEPLGITPAQMNRICRTRLGCSALDLLHQRVLLEAKRELGYTTLQVRQISDALGFADPAYFTRFFRRLSGMSPKQWRKGRATTEAGETDG